MIVLNNSNLNSRSFASDMDECMDGTHGCDVNAECNNTKGSYNCTCKDGFHGNGTNCTGNYPELFYMSVTRISIPTTGQRKHFPEHVK